MPSSASSPGRTARVRACRIRSARSPFVRGGLSDQVRSASTLLTAYMLTARLPYAMLADELMQPSRRTRRQTNADAPFALTCDAARVFCRLAALHRDDDYRRTAVLAVDTDYVREATRTLDALAPSVARTRRRSGAFRPRTRRMARSAMRLLIQIADCRLRCYRLALQSAL